MAITIAASNYLVQYPLLNNWLTYGAFAYPCVFLIEDLSNRLRGAKFAARVVLFGFVVGVLMSFAISTARIASASGGAFLISGLCNVFVFHRLRKLAWWKAPLISSLLASVLDTFLFFALAFAGTDLPWFNLALGDLGAKLLMLVCLLPLYRLLYPRLTSSLAYRAGRQLNF